jgi:hypothetical protein
MKLRKQTKKPWRRFLGPGLVSLTMTCGAIELGLATLLQPGGYSRMWLSEVTLFIARFEHLPVLHKNAQAPVKVNRLQQSLHGCGEHFRRPYLSAELSEASFFVLGRLYFYHCWYTFLAVLVHFEHIIQRS